MITLTHLARILRAAAAECDVIARESAEDRALWVSQAESPLGPRRHIAACRARLRDGIDGAGKAGRRYLLSPTAIAEELGRTAETSPSTDPASDLESRLRLVGGSL